MYYKKILLSNNKSTCTQKLWEKEEQQRNVKRNRDITYFVFYSTLKYKILDISLFNDISIYIKYIFQVSINRLVDLYNSDDYFLS